MRKKKIWNLVILLLIIVAVFFMVAQWRTTTYKEVLTDLISEDEEIRTIDITYYNNSDERVWKDMYLDNNDEMMKIIEQPADMKLKKTTERGDTEYFITVRTTKSAYSISIDNKHNLFIEGHKYNYHIIGDNVLVESIESLGDKWGINKFSKER
ncbi:hypothetical protein [Virgibacillus sp. Bac330]|uniref:hypothetical protein n=1 Tax=Virgibacillus sp. Bac330 TaxID=2419841 RepID=UPI000EF4AB43|nr:hypothetical protein [Virgibacillus sp. Bac330]